MMVCEAMSFWRPGSRDWSWQEETDDLMRRDFLQMQKLIMSIEQDGLRAAMEGENPICLGDDGRVWEGHHRLIAAFQVDPAIHLPSDVVVGRVMARYPEP